MRVTNLLVEASRSTAQMSVASSERALSSVLIREFMLS